MTLREAAGEGRSWSSAFPLGSGDLSGWLKKTTIKAMSPREPHALRVRFYVKTGPMNVSILRKMKQAGALPRQRCTWGSGFVQTMQEAAQILQNSDLELNW